MKIELYAIKTKSGYLATNPAMDHPILCPVCPEGKKRMLRVKEILEDEFKDTFKGSKLIILRETKAT